MRTSTIRFLIVGGLALVALVSVAIWYVQASARAERVPPPASASPSPETGAEVTPALSGPARPPLVPARSAARPSGAVASPPGELMLMARLRTAKDRDPALAVQLARDGNRRFPDSPDAPERSSILIHALVALDLPMDARGEAEEMVNHYPDSAWVREIESFTGAHRHRNMRLDDAGQLEYYDP